MPDLQTPYLETSGNLPPLPSGWEDQLTYVSQYTIASAMNYAMTIATGVRPYRYNALIVATGYDPTGYSLPTGIWAEIESSGFTVTSGYTTPSGGGTSMLLNYDLAGTGIAGFYN